MTEYQYRPLPTDGKWIRVIKLLPASKYTAPIRCHVDTINIDSDAPTPIPRYKAISYAWNEDHTSPLQWPLPSAVPIFCDEQILWIPPNLLYALFRLRKNNVTMSVTLWADSICINQKDTVERGRQVGLMREIFSESEEVIIWLGETVLLHEAQDIPQYRWAGGEHDRRLRKRYKSAYERWDTGFLSTVHGEAFGKISSKRRLRMLSNDASDSASRRRILKAEPCDYYGVFCLLSLVFDGNSPTSINFYQREEGLPEWSQGINAALRGLIDRIWWKRTWVIQECLLAKKATLVMGNMRASWDMIAGAARRIIMDRDEGDIPDTQLGALQTLASLVIQLESPRLDLLAGNFPAPLQILRQFRERNASDPRDKVFGLLGLSKDLIVQPDYSMTAEEVFIETSLKLMTKTRRLDVMAGARAKSQADIPSWCVDWHSYVGEDEWRRLQCLDLYNASGHWEADVRVHLQSNTPLLELPGIVVDVIDNVCPENTPNAGYAMLKVVDDRWASGVGYQVSADTYWRTLCGDIFYHGTDVIGNSRFARATSHDSLQYTMWRRDGRMYQSITPPPEDEPPTGRASHAEEVYKRNQFSYGMQTMTRGRCMFSTTSGRIGIGPKDMEKGDLVAIVPGSHVPLLLREDRTLTCEDAALRQLVTTGRRISSAPSRCSEEHSCHSVIGDVYMEGFMDGEAVWEEPSRRMSMLSMLPPSKRMSRVLSFYPTKRMDKGRMFYLK